jgi:hypothetical protein
MRGGSGSCGRDDGCDFKLRIEVDVVDAVADGRPGGGRGHFFFGVGDWCQVATGPWFFILALHAMLDTCKTKTMTDKIRENVWCRNSCGRAFHRVFTGYWDTEFFGLPVCFFAYRLMTWFTLIRGHWWLFVVWRRVHNNFSPLS